MSILVVFSGLPPRSPKIDHGGVQAAIATQTQRRLNADSTQTQRRLNADPTQTQRRLDATRRNETRRNETRRNAAQRTLSAEGGYTRRTHPKLNADATQTQRRRNADRGKQRCTPHHRLPTQRNSKPPNADGTKPKAANRSQRRSGGAVGASGRSSDARVFCRVRRGGVQRIHGRRSTALWLKARGAYTDLNLKFESRHGCSRHGSRAAARTAPGEEEGPQEVRTQEAESTVPRVRGKCILQA